MKVPLASGHSISSRVKKPRSKRKEQVITHYGVLDLSPETSSHPITDKCLRQIIAFILGGERHTAHDGLGTIIEQFALRICQYMSKLNTSCGLTSQQIDAIKFAIKRNLSLKLPILPDYIETKLFLQGRDAWTYRWDLLDQDAQNPLHPMSVKVDIKLKKEFCQNQLRTHYTFLCKLELQPDIYSPIKSIHEKSP